MTCAAEGGGVGAIYALADDGSTESERDGALLRSERHLGWQVFMVANGNIYFVVSGTVMKMPSSGGEAVTLFRSSGVSHMTTDGRRLIVASSGCGVQAVPL